MEDDTVYLDQDPQSILYNPLTNKGTGFTPEERRDLGLEGLLPAHCSTIEEQVARRYENFCQKNTPLGRYKFLTGLQDRNEILFFRFLYDHVEAMLPLVYTPTVGEASVHYSTIYNQNRGIYLPISLKDRMEEMIDNIPKDEVDVIVVTDGERILGLGDLGVGGMAIPVGKLNLYTLFGGIHPSRTLPVLLDVGTNNPTLLDDPLYLGWRHERVRGKEYDEFVDRFVKAIKKRYPKALLQWEDFAKQNAYPLLERYRDEICSFNDDIQGTASVALSAILAGVKVSGQSLTDQKICLLGAGSAGLGIANLLVEELKEHGLTEDEARRLFYTVDIQGLIHTKLESASPEQKKFAQPYEKIEKWKVDNPDDISLYDVVKNAHPSILIGVSTQTGAFTEAIVREMARNVKRPIICPLSNPTSRAEAEPANLVKWTGGEAIIATGSPFDPVLYEGKTYEIGQCNNVYIFPGVGLAAMLTGAKKVTNSMFMRAARILSENSPMLEQPYAKLFPELQDLRTTTKKIATGVIEVIQKEGLATKELKGNIEEAVGEAMWFPRYPTYKRKK